MPMSGVVFMTVFCLAISSMAQKNSAERLGSTPVLRFHRSFLLDTAGLPAPTRAGIPSKGKAFVLSLVLPGAGEYYAGSKTMANVFFGTEAAMWLGYLSLRTYGDWKKKDYRLFAVAHAGVDLSGKNHQYFVDIENYSNIVDFNDAKLQQRYPNKMYPEDETHYWEWDSETSRKRFERLRLSSDQAYNISLIFIGGIVVNHIVSGIDALRVAKKKDKLDIQVSLYRLDANGTVLTVVKKF